VENSLNLVNKNINKKLINEYVILTIFKLWNIIKIKSVFSFKIKIIYLARHNYYTLLNKTTLPFADLADTAGLLRRDGTGSVELATHPFMQSAERGTVPFIEGNTIPAQPIRTLSSTDFPFGLP